jgi:hypothetical protein
LTTTTGGENFNYDRQINSLPIIQRAPERVAELAPNISFGPTPNTLSIAGAPSFDTVVMLDGAEVSDPYFGNQPVVFLEEALEEVQVLTTGIQARYGRFQGGVINATTKSGGNTFAGSARVDFDKESWNQKTPHPFEEQATELNKVYSATVSGPILKDRLWFFVGGRTIPTSDLRNQTALSGQNYTTTTDEDRWQVKLTGAINPNHVVEGTYSDYERKIANSAGLPPGDLRALAPRDDPRDTSVLEYQGVLTDQLFLNLMGTRKRVSIVSGATEVEASPFLDFYGGGFQIWNNHWWDFNDPSLRDNDTASANLTQVLSTGSWGDHTLEYGIQYVKSTTGGENRQSATGFNLLNYDVFFGSSFTNVGQPGFDPDNPEFTILAGGDGLTYRWVALPLGGDQELENTALYIQDTWQRGRWSVDAGLRWEKYDGKGPEPTLDLDFDALAPRLGVMYNLDNNWQLQASWGKYIARFNDSVASNISGVGGAPYVVSLYTGPGATGVTYEDVEAILRDDSNWGTVLSVTDPTQPTRFLADDIEAPYAFDLNVGVKRALPRNTGTFSLTYTDRQYRDLLDDFIGDFGTTTVSDPFGGPGTFTLDTEVWDNSSLARRDYEALTATFDYRPSAKLSVGGNWTYAKLQGNYEGEGRNTPASPSIIGNYRASVPQEAAIPYGYLDEDIRHRVRAWGSYRFDFGKAGALTVGSIGTYQSGESYSRTGSVNLVGDEPKYANDAGTAYTHFVGGRGNDRFNGFWRLDLGSRYQFTFWRDLAAYLKFDVINVTNNDELIEFNTAGSVVTNSSGIVKFKPGAAFGTSRSPLDYQDARSYFVSVGLNW